MNELDTLRPEVRSAFSRLNQDVHLSPQSFMDWTIIRAELLRLTDAHATLKAQSIHPRAQLLIMLGHANDRAEKAEAELAELKARIAGSDAGIVTQTFSHLGSDGADTTTVEAYPPKVFHSTAIGQRVRLVVEE